MYETESKQPNSKDVFWTKIDPRKKNGEDAVVPGVTAPGNRRPHRPKKMKSNQVKSGRKTTEVKATIPVKSPVKVMNLSADATTITQDLTVESLQEQPHKHFRGNMKKVSLKDLCADDKKRVANLIKELAKMGDEKEAVLGQLQTERREYEKQVLQMVNQQEQILQEREDIQSKLFQCQELLSRYKDQLLEREEQLNTSITEIVYKKESQRRGTADEEEDYEHYRRQSHKQRGNKENIEKGRNELHQKYIEVETTKDRLRRPFTSMIDKEIAKRKQNEDGGLSTIVASESSTTTPPRHQGGRIDYSDRIPVIQAFREPVMSSTQKSADIRAYVEEDSPRDEFQRLEPDMSPRSSRASFPSGSPKGQRSSSPISQSGKSNKVGFKEKLTVDNDELQKHSPQLGSGNKEFLQKYKKLSSTERKHELLKQREALLEEQKRLRKVLMEQEAQLKRKQDIIEKRRSTQQARMDYLEKNGEFPDKDDNEGSVFNVPDSGSVCEGRVDKLNLDRCLSEEDIFNLEDKEEIRREAANKGASTDFPLREPTAISKIQEIKTLGPKNYPKSNTQEKYTRATSPLKLESEDTGSTPSTPRLIDAATSYSRRLDHSIERVAEDPVTTPTRRMDAATSYSCRSPRSPVPNEDFIDLPRQNNLPLQTNRQRACKTSSPRLPSTPGEKTLSVVEIVNSLEEESPAHPSHLIRSSIQRDITPTTTKSIPVGGTAKILSTGGMRLPKNAPFGAPPVKDQFCEELAEETAEESSLLEDIFFL
ncbi:protein hinderin-like isoform X1 [Saccostrea echinata]|uniref:protein hinderin-like isoform X1 n=1 Tax=Saccostrea echinata TaxID=191078 RepID=UPI002A8363E4|nr:protein hinderin-like isoform X1 [Saccostrea echinata]